MTIQIKKIHYKTKLFHFSIKHSQILYHINFFLLLFIYNTTTYQTSPYLPQAFQKSEPACALRFQTPN